jgi:hypothetical protein
MAIDSFKHFQDSPMAPASNCFAVVPDDLQDLPFLTKSLYIGADGNVTLRSAEGVADVTFTNLMAGTVLDLRVRAIRATGTTATAIVGLA